MGALERLTYLLGICTAVIGWSVTQLNATITAQNLIGYSISSSSDGAFQYKTLYLENLSKTYAPSEIAVSFADSGNDCIKDVYYKDTGMRLPYKTTNSSRHGGFETITVPAMPPGTGFAAEARIGSDCNAVPQLNLNSGATQVRLLQRGLQTFVIRNEFGILILLIAIFSAVFAVTFAVAYLKAPKS